MSCLLSAFGSGSIHNITIQINQAELAKACLHSSGLGLSFSCFVRALHPHPQVLVVVGFLFQCSLVFNLQPLNYRSDKAKVAFNVKLLSGSAAQWAIAIIVDHDTFKAEFSCMF